MDTTTHPIPAGGVLDLKATFNLIPRCQVRFLDEQGVPMGTVEDRDYARERRLYAGA